MRCKKCGCGDTWRDEVIGEIIYTGCYKCGYVEVFDRRTGERKIIKEGVK